MIEYVPLLSTIGAFVAGLLMTHAYIVKRENVYLVAMSSMYLFSFGAFLEFLSSYLGYWPEMLYRLYYGTSPVQPGVLAAAILGLYSYTEFTRHGKIFKIYMGYVSIIGLIVFVLSLIAEIKLELLSNPYVGGAAMASYVRIFSPFLTIPSGLIMIFYPLYTFFKGMRNIDKILLPTAAIITMIGGFMIRRGYVTTFYIFELLGALTILTAFYFIYRKTIE